MPAFVEKYNDDQRDAMAYAFEDRKIRPAQRVVELAARGELTHRGEKLPPFEANPESVRHYARLARKRRAGRIQSSLAEKPHKDAMDALRRRLINVADALLASYEKTAKRSPEKADPERLRQIGRAMLEIQRLDPNPEKRAPSADTRDARGRKTGPETKAGLAGALLKAHRTGEGAPEIPDHEPRADVDSEDTYHGENGAQSEATDATQPGTDEQQGDVPGSWARVRAEQLRASSP